MYLRIVCCGLTTVKSGVHFAIWNAKLSLFRISECFFFYIIHPLPPFPWPPFPPSLPPPLHTGLFCDWGYLSWFPLLDKILICCRDHDGVLYDVAWKNDVDGKMCSCVRRTNGYFIFFLFLSLRFSFLIKERRAALFVFVVLLKREFCYMHCFVVRISAIFLWELTLGFSRVEKGQGCRFWEVVISFVLIWFHDNHILLLEYNVWELMMLTFCILHTSLFFCCCCFFFPFFSILLWWWFQ